MVCTLIFFIGYFLINKVVRLSFNEYKHCNGLINNVVNFDPAIKTEVKSNQ